MNFGNISRTKSRKTWNIYGFWRVILWMNLYKTAKVVGFCLNLARFCHWWIMTGSGGSGLTNETFKKWILPRRHLCLTHKIVFGENITEGFGQMGRVFLHKLLFLVSLAYRNQRGISIFSKQREPRLGWGYFSWLRVEEEKSHQDFLLWANNLTKKLQKKSVVLSFSLPKRVHRQCE